ncbi:MAG: phosphotransferase, partial [Pseudomonadota bacterium]
MTTASFFDRLFKAEGPGVAADRPPRRAAFSSEARAERSAAFLDAAGWGGAARESLAGDASNRRYERLTHPNGSAAVLMDAPSEKGEDVRPFAALTGHLRERGLSAPEILAADLEDGFLLLEDLGDELYARVAARAPEDEKLLYQQAVELLAALHSRPAPAAAQAAGPAPGPGWEATLVLRPYDMAELQREAMLFLDWWQTGATGAAATEWARKSFETALAAMLREIASARDALVLRDFHAENLIWLPSRGRLACVGLLDYQDALIGHPAYDLVSLLEDARRDVAPELAEEMIALYVARRGLATMEEDRFRLAYAALGAQRNLKIIGIFARLWLRDGKERYLAHVPRVWAHLRRGLAARPELARMSGWLEANAAAPTAEAL